MKEIDLTDVEFDFVELFDHYMYFLLNLYTAVIMPDIEIITQKLRKVFLNEKVIKKISHKDVMEKYINAPKTYNSNTKHKTEIVLTCHLKNKPKKPKKKKQEFVFFFSFINFNEKKIMNHENIKSKQIIKYQMMFFYY